MAQHLQVVLQPLYVVDVVTDGKALTAAAARELPDINNSDIAMPGIRGLVAARHILSKQPEARIIFATVLHEPAIIRQALADGASGYIMTGDAGEELAHAVDKVLAGGRYVSSSAHAALGGTWSDD